MPPGVLVDLNVVISKASLFVGQRAINQLFELLNVERLQPKNLRARDKGTGYIKERVVSSCADEPKISSLDVRQENVLLRFVEVVDLIDEQDRLLA